MDPSRFAVTLAVLLIGIGLGRVVIGSAGRAGDAMAALFVPPDRALGWPHGVQESDEPWGWRPGAPAFDPDGAAADGDGEGGNGEGDTTPMPAGRGDWIDPPRGTFRVPVGPVDPVHVGTRTH